MNCSEPQPNKAFTKILADARYRRHYGVLHFSVHSIQNASREPVPHPTLRYTLVGSAMNRPLPTRQPPALARSLGGPGISSDVFVYAFMHLNPKTQLKT